MRIERIHTAEELDQEPEADKNEGRQPNCPPDDDKRHQRENASSRKQNNVRSKHSGNSSTRANGRDVRAPRDQNFADSCSNAAKQIKEKVGNRAEGIFNICAKDPQEKHIADNVQKTTVQEHTCEEWQKCLYERVTPAGKRQRDLVRYESIYIDKGFACMGR